jgi:uncharacterized protein (DUF2336 family)
VDVIYAELKQLAEERSSEKRLDLLRRITDLFLVNIERYSDVEISLFNDVVDSIVERVSREAQIDVATNLVTIPGFPLPVAHKLANAADIEIARPVIRGFLGFTDRDLIAIARRASDDHLDAVAGRSQLSEAVTDVLIDRGSAQVMHTVSANQSARFSQRGMDTLVIKARDDSALQGLLVERADLPQRAAETLSSIVSEALAIKLKERGYQVCDTVPDQLVEAVCEDFTRAVRDRDRNSLAAERIIAQFGAGRFTLEQALLAVIECDQMLAVAALLSHSTGIERQMLMCILASGPLHTVLVLLRALELKWETVNALLALRSSKQHSRHEVSRDSRRDYESIEISAAKRTLRFLQIRTKATGDVSLGDAPNAIKRSR